MKISVDASILIGAHTAYGRLSGDLDLGGIPGPMALITFLFPINEPVSPPAEFIGQLRVKEVIFRPTDGKGGVVLVMLEDLIVPSEREATAVSDYLARGFGLFVETH